MLRLAGGQVEVLFDELLPVEVRELPEDLAVLDRLLVDPRLLAPIEPPGRSAADGTAGRRAASTVRADPVDLQRGPASVRGPGRPARRRSRPPAALVGLATPTSSPRPYLPLPTTGRLATMKITIYGWSTNPSISWLRRACGPGPANDGGIP
jgi:hypothetical protein